MKRMREVIQELGDAVHSRWQQHSFDEDRLAGIAVAELERHQVHGSAGLEDITELMFQANAESRVPINESFGDAAVTLYRAPRFFIEALVWTDGTTSIHQHGFSGAFQVIFGGSFHGQYRFDALERVNAAMALGHLALARTELLRVGDIRAIEAGSRFIHNLFHLDAPSITLVVRTYTNRGAEPQLNYLPPGLGTDPFFKDPVLTHQTRYMRMLLNLEHASAETTLRDHLVRSDLYSAFRMLEGLRELLVAKKLWEPAIGCVRAAHPRSVEWLEGAFQELVRRHHIVAKRRLIQDRELRFFMAMLLNVPTMPQIRELTRARFPEAAPDDQIVKWVARVLDAHHAEYDEGNVDIIRYMLEEANDDYVVSRLREVYGDEDVTAQLPTIKELCNEFRQNVLFSALLQH